jgi:hypothetical protein
MLTQIALRRLQLWMIDAKPKDPLQRQVLGFELGQLGYRISNIDDFTAITRPEFKTALSILKAMRGGDVKYVPLFKRFPDDLPNDHEYLIRRIIGFFGLNTFAKPERFGANPIDQRQRQDLWQAAVAAQEAQLRDTHTEWLTLTLVSPDEAAQQLRQWVLDLIYGATAIKEALWQDIFTILEHVEIEIEFEQIPVKETLARLAAHHWQEWTHVNLNTPTDLLRMLAFLQGQDVSLAQPIDLKGLKLSKPQRRAIVDFLNRCPALSEDLLRYPRLWISLSRWLHPGDFTKRFPAVAKAFDDLRNDRIKSFDSGVINAPIEAQIHTLLQRPSVFLRRLTWLLKDHSPQVVTDGILSLQDQVATLPLPLLVTTYCALDYGGDRVIINKKGKPYTIQKRKSLGDISGVLAAIETLILTKLEGSKNWHKVWLDPAIDKLVLPLQARKQSDGLLNLGRGSRIALDPTVLRLFIYWHENTKQTDLDLSALKLNKQFECVGHVSWNNYGSNNNIAHSGDIQSAPLGAAEFIDLRLSALKDHYIVPAIIHYIGDSFADLKACYAGWMHREAVGSDRQSFDPKTVAEKVNVNQNGRMWVPFMFDLKAKEMIYTDLYLAGQRTIEANPHFPALAAALATYWQARPTFGRLARWYVQANHARLVPKHDAIVTIGTSDDCSINVLKLVGQGVTSF